MPQLVKGGKNVFGWSVVNENGRIVIPLDAFTEYRFIDGEKVILMSGSKKSGGFGLTTLKLLKGSPLSRILGTNPELAEFRIREGEGIDSNSKIYCWVTINNRSIFVPRDTFKNVWHQKKRLPAYGQR